MRIPKLSIGFNRNVSGAPIRTGSTPSQSLARSFGARLIGIPGTDIGEHAVKDVKCDTFCCGVCSCCAI